MSKQPKPPLSDCCNAPVEVKLSQPKPWQTNYWLCTKCQLPCNVYNKIFKKDIKGGPKVNINVKKSFPIEIPTSMYMDGFGLVNKGDEIRVDVEKGKVTDVKITRKNIEPTRFIFGERQVD